jgi:hypothetical protein
VGTRRPGKGQNMEINEKRIHVRNVYKYTKPPNMYRNQMFPNEIGCILNEKMMPDVSIMVPELEIFKNFENQKLNEQMW